MQTLNRKLAGLQQELESVAGIDQNHLLAVLSYSALQRVALEVET